MSLAIRRTGLFALNLVMATLVMVASGPDALARDSLYRRVVHSTVLIATDFGAGTGTIVERDDMPVILTNYHVVAGSDEIRVFFPAVEEGRLVAEASYYFERIDELAVPGIVVAVDPLRDLALIELDEFPARTDRLPLADMSPDPGEQVYSVGNPGASDALWVYASGSVRSVYRKTMEFSPNETAQTRVVEIDSDLNPGDSGGPLVNDLGELVGIVQAGLVYADGMNYCIDVSEVRYFLAGEITSLVDERVRALFDSLDSEFKVSELGVFSTMQPVAYSQEPLPVFVRSQTTTLGDQERRAVFAELALDPRSLAYILPYVVDEDMGWEGNWTVEAAGDYLCFLIYNVRISAGCSAKSLAAALQEAASGVDRLAELNRRLHLTAQ